jgi:hypothetical protein
MDSKPDLSQRLAPAVKEIASGQWTKAVPLLTGVVAGVVTGNPLLGAVAMRTKVSAVLPMTYVAHDRR